MIRLYREDENYSPASSPGLWWYTPSSSEMRFKLRQKEKGHLAACNKWSVTGDIQTGRVGSLVKAQRQRRRDEKQMQREDAVLCAGAPCRSSSSFFLNPSSYFPSKSLKRQFRFRKSILFLYARKKNNHPHTLGLWLLVFCFSVGVGKRSSGTLPPVGGAQQSQVAMGGTEALLRSRRRRRRRLGSSQHLCALNRLEKAVSGQERFL